MDIGEPRKIIEVEPATIPVPETIPMPDTEPASPAEAPTRPAAPPADDPVPGSRAAST
jgi:hypothetical protein